MNWGRAKDNSNAANNNDIILYLLTIKDVHSIPLTTTKKSGFKTISI